MEKIFLTTSDQLASRRIVSLRISQVLEVYWSNWYGPRSKAGLEGGPVSYVEHVEEEIKNESHKKIPVKSLALYSEPLPEGVRLKYTSYFRSDTMERMCAISLLSV